MKEFMTGNHAVARAVRLCRTPLIAAYPITPQTPIYEKLSEWEASGELKGIMMRTESEHSAMASCIAASLTGVRTFTATSSQGLALMHEMLHFAAGCRVPVVMANVNRLLAAPWGFWADQLDSLSQRDTGWIQFYCENGQEALDSVIQAYRIAEQVFLPAMISLEAFFVSHFMEPVDTPEQEQVDRFLPPIHLPHQFDIDKPGFLVPVVSSELYRKYKHMAQISMDSVKEIAARVDDEYREEFGRGYGIIETMMLEDAEVVIVTAGSITSTARVTIKALREQGHRVGLLKIRLFRPFPGEAIRDALRKKKKIAVIDRNISLGGGGIFCQELRAALVHSPDHPMTFSYIAGIGGTDVDPEVIQGIAFDAINRTGPVDESIWIMGG
ncbi:MAG: transketolase C-terminal domain-containing protein [Thermodesulfobacteriota bacterium]|nr:transketolase C-terminal domain-containing protein [Thermodesulfobacteriota bacterium]